MLEVTSAPRLVLASTSRYRAEVLGRLGVPFETRAPDVDERAFDDRFAGSTPERFACMLAAAKAEQVAAALRDEGGFAHDVVHAGWVLGADQLAIMPGDPPRLLHKPGTAERAVDQLMALAGRTHVLVTGVVLRPIGNDFGNRFGTGRILEGADRVTLHMRAFGRDEAAAYIDAFAPLDCVGAYRIEDAGIRLVDAIEGSADPTSIIGLPLLLVARLLRQAGLLPT